VVVSVMKRPMGFYFLPFADEHCLPRVCLFDFSILHAEMVGAGAGFADVSAGLSRPRHVRHIPRFIGSRVIKEGT